MNAKHIAHSTAFPSTIKFDSRTVFETSDTQRVCAHLGVSTQFSAPYAHHILGKQAERPWRTLRDCASAMIHAMSVSPAMWSCAINTNVFLGNCKFNRTAGPRGGVFLTLLTGAIPDASVFREFGCAAFAKFQTTNAKN
jgi:hypothetical protein